MQQSFPFWESNHLAGFEQTRMPRAHLSTSKSKYPGVRIINLCFQIVYGEIVQQQSRLKITTLECLWKISPSFEISLPAWPPGERAKDENRVRYRLCIFMAPGKGEAFVVPRLRCLCGPGPVMTVGDCIIIFFPHTNPYLRELRTKLHKAERLGKISSVFTSRTLPNCKI